MRRSGDRAGSTFAVAAVLVAASAGVVSKPSPPSQATNQSFSARSGVTSVSEVMGRLDKPNRRFRVLVIGDSTGVDPSGWQQLTMQWLSEETGRPWRMHTWDAAAEQPAYAPTARYAGTTKLAPMVMWNASAAGRNWQYTADHIEDMAPGTMRRLDLVFVNHGHNIRPAGKYATIGYPVIDSLRARFPEAAVVLFTQNPVTGDAPLNSKRARKYVHRYHETHGVAQFGVYRKFQQSGRLEELVDAQNSRHPTAAGYQLWFDVVRSRLRSGL